LTSSSVSKPSFDVTCAVPRTGRTLHNFLRKLKSLDANNEEIDQILKVLAESKRRSTPDLQEALSFLQEISIIIFSRKFIYFFNGEISKHWQD